MTNQKYPNRNKISGPDVLTGEVKSAFTRMNRLAGA